jgi:hypothetical protein
VADRARWQYCQVEVGTNGMGVLRQFFAERDPIQTDLHNTWGPMIAKLGDQGWEMISVFANEGGRGRTYVFKRQM